MRVIYNNVIPFKGFTAINLLGIIFARREFMPLEREALIHERIHTAQMVETLFVGFYLVYIINFLILLFIKRNRKEAYRGIAFEREAYCFQCDDHYLENRKYFHWIHCLSD